MQFKPGDTVIPIISDQEQTSPQELKEIHTKDGEILYELTDGKKYPALTPGDKRTWALVTLRHGYSVIPIEAGGKKPPIVDKKTDARFSWEQYQNRHADEQEVKEWFDRWPDCNYGIVGGFVSNAIILDIDGPIGEKYAKDQGGIPETPTSTTGKGKHIHFRHPDYKINNRVFRELELDIRGDGGYIVAPASWHAEKQKTYRWLKDPWTTPLADAPLWLLELAQRKEKNNKVHQENDSYAEAAFSDELAILARTQEGERNDQLNKSAYALGQIVGAGALDENKVRTSLFAIATAVGLPEKEARATIESGIEVGKQQPRDIPKKDYDDLPPLPNVTPDLLNEKHQELLKSNEQNRPQRFQEMVDLLANTDPFTTEAYVDKLASDKIAAKTLTRKAIKQSAQKQKAQTKQGQRPNPTHDELGDRWIAQHSGLTIFVYDKWHRYKNGIWRITEEVESEIWDILVQAKSEGIRPQKNIKVSVIDYTKNQCRKADEVMNSDPNLIAMQNGVFDLTKLEMVPYDPLHYMTSKLPFDYDENAKCPLWEETMLDWLSCNGLGIKHLQEAIGYSITGDTKYQMAWMLAGEGSNGKDTLLELLRCLVGNAHHELDLSALSVDDRYGLAKLPGKKLVTCAEAVSDRPVADTYLKKIISGEPMEARLPYGAPFNFQPICKIWWSVNDKPLVTDQTKGYWRRWTVVPFLESYLGREDFDLEGKLKKELSGIFNWALKGLQRLEKNAGFTKVPEYIKATEDYRHRTSVEALFIEEACEINPLTKTAIKTLYANYKTYCMENGYRAKGKRRFTDDMVRLGYNRMRLGGGTKALNGLLVKDQLQWD